MASSTVAANQFHLSPAGGEGVGVSGGGGSSNTTHICNWGGDNPTITAVGFAIVSDAVSDQKSSAETEI